MDGLPLHVHNQGPGPEPRHAPCPRSDPGILPLWQNMLNLWNKLDLSSACPIPLTQWPRKRKRTFSFHIFLLLFKYSWLHFRPISLPTPPHPLDPTPFPFVHVSFIHVPQKSCPLFPHYPYKSLFWLLSVSSLFQCFVLYFACFFVLFTSCPL